MYVCMYVLLLFGRVRQALRVVCTLHIAQVAQGAVGGCAAIAAVLADLDALNQLLGLRIGQRCDQLSDSLRLGHVFLEVHSSENSCIATVRFVAGQGGRHNGDRRLRGDAGLHTGGTSSVGLRETKGVVAIENQLGGICESGEVDRAARGVVGVGRGVDVRLPVIARDVEHSSLSDSYI